jgi:hypothetical protein
VYHLELRQFPRSVCRFNLTEQELRAVVEPWAREQWLDLGEHKWNPGQARLTILEGPRLPLHQLTMGRGWRIAQRQCKEVTERVLASAREGAAAMSEPAREDSSSSSSSSSDLQGDSLGLELLSLLEPAPAPLSRAWRLARSRFPGRSASECLALAEQAVRALLRGHLIVLLPVPEHAQDGARATGEAGAEIGEAELERLLGALETWIVEDERAPVRMRRA